MKAKSAVLVALQFVFIGALLLSGPCFARRWYWLALEIAGIALVLWAVWVMRLRQLRIGPDVAAAATLVERGPYRYVRHPMYTGSMLIMLALVLDAVTWWRVLLWVGLVGALVAKLTHEERLLSASFPKYAEYRSRTKRLVPFVW